jgi:hypothetical protein
VLCCGSSYDTWCWFFDVGAIMKRQVNERLRRQDKKRRKLNIKELRQWKLKLQNNELLPIYYNINSITIED